MVLVFLLKGFVMKSHWNWICLIGISFVFSVVADARPKSNPSGSTRPQQGSLKVGDDAPDFTLKKIKEDDEKKKTIKLSTFKGKKPVVLIFGSYT